ncbi:MAG: sodium transporter, partial [Muribaculaceae bacterium]
MPEYLGRRFDNRSRKYFSFITIIGNVFLDAGAALYTGALILKVIFPDLDMMWVICGMALMAGTYTIIGGLSSAIYADMIQSVVLIIGSVVLSLFCFSTIGGWDQFVTQFHDG